jgi:hypothetical protein
MRRADRPRKAGEEDEMKSSQIGQILRWQEFTTSKATPCVHEGDLVGEA